MLRLDEIRDNACQLHARTVHCYVTAISQLLPATLRARCLRAYGFTCRRIEAIVLLEIVLVRAFPPMALSIPSAARDLDTYIAHAKHRMRPARFRARSARLLRLSGSKIVRGARNSRSMKLFASENARCHVD